MKIFIIGSNSFIGSSYVRYLFQNSLEKKIYGCSRNKKKKIKTINFNIQEKNYFFYRIDLNKNIDDLIRLLKKIKPQIIINFAAQSIVETSWKYPIDWYNTNLISNIKLLDYLKNVDYLDRYIHSSTPEVYGSTSKKIKESFSYYPNTPYASSKASIDMLLKNYYDQYNFPVIFTRIANIYGPGQQVFKIIPKTILSIKKNKKITLHGGGLSERSFIYSDDVSSALYKIQKKSKAGEIYHISNEDKISIKNLIKTICKIMNVDYKSFVVNTEERPGKDKVYDLSANKIKNKLGWKTKTELLVGIKKTKLWIDTDFHELKNKKLYYEHEK